MLAPTKRFPQRDGMYFLPDQVVNYDEAIAGTGS